ncbi:MAG: ABC transporter ATP-binding protein [Pseudomonadota bacterium]|jgi:lipoprotein-releasing system ATP-binding protein|nr:ABC transporter ATP-binding protein [Alphaproteobacteria bacterium]MEC7124019.1 ABC transporter ATP-binding protein [Pseudomonadota bacterium]MEC7516392.1 ABC transporter ATP-binding protein [Pseudomonadota bacterium]MEC7593347.1 ABC transporter ATP-binding protein [Pseudomonadota bacterium]MEC7674919.1 ABC transporter ATP-binding protein [Pseudomonadota bacterium]
MSEALALRGVHRAFPEAAGSRRLEVLRGVDLTIKAGEIVALVGPSGAGKSTLLHIAGLLEKPDSGQVVLDGHDYSQAGEAARTQARRAYLGFVYQFHHLLPEFSALENIVLPQMIAGLSRRQAGARALDLLRMVGLEARANHRPAKLSGGEQQRVAIARAIANVPRLLLADEPTGNLDPGTAGHVFEQLRGIAKAAGLAALVATHNLDLAGQMDRVLTLRDGHLEVL